MHNLIEELRLYSYRGETGEKQAMSQAAATLARFSSALEKIAASGATLGYKTEQAKTLQKIAREALNH